jgi:regulatory protein
MKQITEITFENRGQKAKIYDEEGLLLETDPEVVYQLDLKKGMVLDEQAFLDVKKYVDEKKAYNQSLRYLTFKERTTEEIKTQLTQKGFNMEVIENVMKKLRHYGFVDDVRYTEQYVKDKCLFSDVGRHRIAADLEKKGISKALSRPYLDRYGDEENQLEKAKTLMEKLQKRMEKDPYRQKMDKIGRRLQEKGYGPDVVRQTVALIVKEPEESLVYLQTLDKKVRSAMGKNQKKKLDPRMVKAKVAQQLMGKGYAWDEIQEALRRQETQED